MSVDPRISLFVVQEGVAPVEPRGGSQAVLRALVQGDPHPSERGVGAGHHQLRARLRVSGGEGQHLSHPVPPREERRGGPGCAEELPGSGSAL